MTASQPDTNVLHLDGVNVVFGGRPVLQVRQLAVGAGEVVAVLGPNGAGKSTLLRAGALLLTPSAGTVQLFGELVEGRRQRTRLRRRTASVFGAATLLDMSVRSNVETALRIRGVPAEERRRRVDHWLERFEIGERAGARPHTLSAGEAQRASLARAFAVEPELLFLDEPFSALDLDTRARLVGELRELLHAERVAALLVTHDRTEARLMADRVAILLDGRIEQQGPAEEVFTAPRTTQVAAFLGYSLLPADLLPATRPSAATSTACVPPEAATLTTEDTPGARAARVVAVQGAAGRAQLVVDIGAPLTLDVPVERASDPSLHAGATVHVTIDEQRIVWL